MNILKVIKDLEKEDNEELKNQLKEYCKVDFSLLINEIINNMPKASNNYILVKTLLTYYYPQSLYNYGACRIYSIYDKSKLENLLKELKVYNITENDIILDKDNHPSNFRNCSNLDYMTINIQKLGKSDLWKKPKPLNSDDCRDNDIVPIHPTHAMYGAANTICGNAELYLSDVYLYTDENDDPFDDSKFPIPGYIELFHKKAYNFVNEKYNIFALSDESLITLMLNFLAIQNGNIQENDKRDPQFKLSQKQ